MKRWKEDHFILVVSMLSHSLCHQARIQVKAWQRKECNVAPKETERREGWPRWMNLWDGKASLLRWNEAARPYLTSFLLITSCPSHISPLPNVTCLFPRDERDTGCGRKVTPLFIPLVTHSPNLSIWKRLDWESEWVGEERNDRKEEKWRREISYY